MTGILADESDRYWLWCPPFSPYPFLYVRGDSRNTNADQAVKKVGAEHDLLVEIFERIEAFLRRLETYTEVTPNQGMLDTITAIMVEILNTLAIATNQIKRGRMSKSLLYDYVAVDVTLSRKISKDPDRKERH